jgi:hypothetical protein
VVEPGLVLGDAPRVVEALEALLGDKSEGLKATAWRSGR